MSKKVLIIGAGYAGIETALTLNKKKKKDELEITLVDKNSYHTLLTELHEAAGNRVSEEAVRIPLDRIFKYTDVKVILDEIETFDFARNTVSSDTKEYTYDYLVVSMGSTPNFLGITGLKENAFTLWSFEDAVKIREHVKRCFTLAAQEKDPDTRKKLLTFVVGGAGFTGVEMIGELAFWTKDLSKFHNIDYSEVRLVIVDMLPRILNNLSEKNAKTAHKYMEKKLGIEILLNTSIKEVTSEGFSTGDKFIGTQTLIWAAGVRSCSEADEMPVEKLGGPRRLKVDKFCRTQAANVYAAGDLSCLLNDEGEPYPAMVENAVQTGHGVAMNILRVIRNQEQEVVKVKMHGTMVSVGNFFAVSEIMGRILPIWLSIVMKFMVNIHYLWEITGFWGPARYLYHEILERRQSKLLLERHWSTRMQVWWVVPLRLFLGWTWLYEGIKKIGEGWFTSPKLANFLGYVTSAAQSGTDATSSATSAAGGSAAGAATAAAPVIQNIFSLNLGILQVHLEKTTEMIFRIDIGIVKRFIQTFALASDTSQMFFQIVVVIAEIAIGLALISGTFTFLASLASLAMMANFMTTTGIYERTWWMLFAAVACMGGAGRAFGVDYYLIPYLNNLWEYIWKNHKFKLFFKPTTSGS